MNVINTAFLGFLAGVVGTGLGGVYPLFSRNLNPKDMTYILGFSGGIMLVAVFAELIPEAIEIAGLINTVIGILIGITFLKSIKWVLGEVSPEFTKESSVFTRTGILLFLSIACHNLPEGMAIGSGYAASERVGFILVVTLALHNIPEGLAVATAFILGGKTPLKALFLTMLSGVPMVIGTIIGHVIGNISYDMISISLGFAAGAMIYTVCDEILPQVLTVDKSSSWGLIWGLVSGIILFNIL